METLVRRSNNNVAAVEKLCREVLPQNFWPVVDRILLLNDPAVIAFMSDIADLNCPVGNVAYLCNNVSALTPDLVGAWEVIYEAKSSGFRKDWASLTNYKDLRKTVIFYLRGETSLENILRRNARQPCNTCQPSSSTKDYLNSLDKYILDLKHLSTFSQTNGYLRVLSLLNSHELARKLEPQTFIVRVLKSESLAATAFEYDRTGCQPDVVLQGDILCEFKSWRTNLSTNADDNTIEDEDYDFGNTLSTYSSSRTAFENFVGGHTGVKQFIAYLSLPEINSMEKLRYYFDARKGATEPYVKSAFKQMMYDGTELTTNGSKVFDAIWGNIGLRGNLWKPTEYPNITEPQARLIFTGWVSSMDAKIFNFIKVK